MKWFNQLKCDVVWRNLVLTLSLYVFQTKTNKQICKQTAEQRKLSAYQLGIGNFPPSTAVSRTLDKQTYSLPLISFIANVVFVDLGWWWDIDVWLENFQSLQFPLFIIKKDSNVYLHVWWYKTKPSPTPCRRRQTSSFINFANPSFEFVESILLLSKDVCFQTVRSSSRVLWHLVNNKIACDSCICLIIDKIHNCRVHDYHFLHPHRYRHLELFMCSGIEETIGILDEIFFSSSFPFRNTYFHLSDCWIGLLIRWCKQQEKRDWRGKKKVMNNVFNLWVYTAEERMKRETV